MTTTIRRYTDAELVAAWDAPDGPPINLDEIKAEAAARFVETTPPACPTWCQYPDRHRFVTWEMTENGMQVGRYHQRVLIDGIKLICRDQVLSNTFTRTRPEIELHSTDEYFELPVFSDHAPKLVEAITAAQEHLARADAEWRAGR